MILFADVDPGTQNGIAMALIGALGTAFGLFVGYLKDRDRLRYDARLAAAERRSQECDEKHAETEAKLTACEEKHKTVELELRDIRNSIATLQQR